MSDPETPPPADEKPKDRRWFVVLAWITLVAFGLFIAGITLAAVFIPELREGAGP